MVRFALIVLVACSSSRSRSDDAAVIVDSRVDAGPDPECMQTFRRASEGVTSFGPAYGAYPPATQPPLAYLAPDDCIAVRIETLPPDGLRLQIDGDEAHRWAAKVQVDNVTTMLDVVSVGNGVVEAVATIPNHPTYITVTGWPVTSSGCTRSLSLRRFDDGTVAVVGYGGADCAGPRSLKRYKTAIDYLTPRETEAVRAEVMALRVARYRYLEDPTAKTRVGIMLDDVASSSLLVDGDRVDLYSYASLAIATIQAQQRELDELRARVERLERARQAKH